jgi:uncharacterized membrane protein
MVSKGLLGGFVADRRGNIATIAALTFSVTLGAAAFGIDIGKLAADKRRLQSAADLAAIVAASNVGKAEAAAVSAAQRNGFDAGAMKLVERGVYTPSAAVQAQKRFVPSNGADANAVRVSMSAQSELMFAKLLVGKDRYDIQATATAATTGVATFAIGSRLVSLNGGLLNAILGATLGTNISLSAMDYQALLDARVDAFDFVNALATKVAVTGVTYNDVLAMNVKVGDILSATQASMVGSAAARAALGSIIQSVNGQGGTIVPSTILNPGPYGSLQVGQKPRTAVSLSAYDLVAASARLADGTNQIAASLNLNLPGIVSAELMATVGEMPKGKSWIAIGTQGASVHTAQTRVYLVLQLAGGSGIASVTLPLYVEVATGTAVLDQMNCAYNDTQSTSVTLAVTPGIVDASIGVVPPSQMTDFSRPPSPTPATIVNTALLRVTGKAQAKMANTAPTKVTFSQADISARAKKTVNTTSYTSSLTSSLLNNLQLSVSLLGPLPIPGVAAIVTGLLSGPTAAIDSALASTFAALGVGLCQVDVWVPGVRCDGAVLVN